MQNVGTYLILSLIFSGIGFVYFAYGKKQSEFMFMLAGGIMFFYPYVITSPLWMTVVGLALMASPFIVERFDL